MAASAKSFLDGINYGSPSAQTGAVITSSNPKSFLSGINYGSTPQEQSADSLLTHIGKNFENLTRDSSGVMGLFLPGMAQQEQTNASPIIQGQLQTTLGIPPALLNKLIAQGGGAPAVAEQEGMASTIGGAPTAPIGLAMPNPKDILAAAGKYGQSALKSLPQMAFTGMGISPESFQGLQNAYQQGISPVSNYPINKALGINTQGIGGEENRMTETALQQIPGLIGAGEGIKGISDLLSEGTKSLTSKLSRNSLKNLMQEIPGEKGPSNILSNRMYDAKNIYNSAVPDSTNGLTITKGIKLPGGSNFSKNDLLILQKSDPTYFKTLEPLIRKNEDTPSPLQDFLGTNYSTIKNMRGGKAVLDAAENNFNVGGLHNFSKDLYDLADGAPTTNLRNTLYKESQRVRDNLVKPTLAREDSLNGTNVLGTGESFNYPGYSQADEYFKNQVLPYRANTRLNQYANGLIDPKNASKKDLRNAISEALEKSSGRVNPTTGLEDPFVPAGHHLRDIYSRMQQSRAKKIGATVGSGALATIPGYRLLKDMFS